MEVMVKSSLQVVKEEKIMADQCVGAEEGDGDIGKFGSEAPTDDGERSKSSSPDRKDSSISKQVFNERSPVDSTSRPSTSSPKEYSNTINQEDHQLESTRAEMGEVRQENERLKMVLARIVKDYQSLQMHLFDIVQQDQDKKPVETANLHRETEESELVSLRLGTSASGGHKKESTGNKEDEQIIKAGLSLGLDCKFDGSGSDPSGEPQSNLSPEPTVEEPREEEEEEEEAREPRPPSKMMKTVRSGDDESSSQQIHVKKARVSVRARCDAPTMNDGCQWRKYGQKIAKGNPCPRAYYRCTVAPACPVRKQVQRCVEDMSILITTYEGTHNHPLPISATAMASTTSAAASMLMSGSSASRPAVGAPAMTTSAATGNASLHGLNFSLSDNSIRHRQFYLPNPTISSSPSYPTITLDLTSSSSTSTQFNRFSSNFPSTSRYSPASFNFASSESNTASTPTSWNSSGCSYGTQPYNNKNEIGSFNLIGDPFYQSYMQKISCTNSAPPATTQHPLTDTIAAATKAITADPSFQSALAAAITSIVGGNNGNQAAGETPDQSLIRWGDQQFSSVSPIASAPNGNGRASSRYLTRSNSSISNPQQVNTPFLRPPLAFSSSKGASASPVANRDHIN